MTMPSAEQRVQEGDTVALDADVKPPQLVKQVQPRVPIQASRMNVKGRLVCRVLISHTGAVERVQVVSADSPRVKELYSGVTEEALRQWRYTPAEKGGVKVKVWKTVTLGF
jgi:outer membrane biosynthesis protein TonB